MSFSTNMTYYSDCEANSCIDYLASRNQSIATQKEYSKTPNASANNDSMGSNNYFAGGTIPPASGRQPSKTFNLNPAIQKQPVNDVKESKGQLCNRRALFIVTALVILAVLLAILVPVLIAKLGERNLQNCSEQWGEWSKCDCLGIRSRYRCDEMDDDPESRICDPHPDCSAQQLQCNDQWSSWGECDCFGDQMRDRCGEIESQSCTAPSSCSRQIDSQCTESNAGGMVSLSFTNRTFNAYCERGWILIDQNSNNSLEFRQNKGAGRFKNQFGKSDGISDFWVGLDNLHAMAISGSWQARIELTDSDGNIQNVNYGQFSVGSGPDYRASFRNRQKSKKNSIGRLFECRVTIPGHLTELLKHIDEINKFQKNTFNLQFISFWTWFLKKQTAENQPFNDRNPCGQMGPWWYPMGCGTVYLHDKTPYVFDCRELNSFLNDPLKLARRLIFKEGNVLRDIITRERFKKKFSKIRILLRRA